MFLTLVRDQEGQGKWVDCKSLKTKEALTNAARTSKYKAYSGGSLLTTDGNKKEPGGS